MNSVVTIESLLFNSLIIEDRLATCVDKKQQAKQQQSQDSKRDIIGMVISFKPPSPIDDFNADLRWMVTSGYRRSNYLNPY